ncbi:MAG: putative OB-fold protein [Natronomonas sp.]|jgi:uncharacterized OB-fold protein|uniref:Zn-ribbon domain-containing OB-fold protein n=1 Tax=Natronomonas sp. TaxID=2184060 RepID=UPI003989CC6B
MSDRLTHEEWSTAVREGELLGQSCPDCGAVQGTPKAACPHCGTVGLETVELPTEGTVYTETTINVPPINVEERGYQVAVVQLGDARVLGRLVDQDVDIGDTVAVSGYDEDDQGYPTPRFEAE